MKIRDNKKFRWLTGFLFCTIFLLSGCQSRVVVPETVSEPLRLERILVLPFKNMAEIYGENVSVRCSLCNNIFTTDKVDEGADRFLTEQMMSLLSSKKSIQLIPEGQAEGVRSGLLSKNGKEMTERDLLVAMGRALGADAVMVGRIFRFRERSGTRYSVESPASVAFDIDLVGVPDGRLLWTAHFDETQKDLSENLFLLGTFIKRKGQWITAEAMAASGLEDIFQRFPVP